MAELPPGVSEATMALWCSRGHRWEAAAYSDEGGTFLLDEDGARCPQPHCGHVALDDSDPTKNLFGEGVDNRYFDKPIPSGYTKGLDGIWRIPEPCAECGSTTVHRADCPGQEC
jgi:hypothetical protein